MASTPPPGPTCSEVDCKIAEGGRCLEGFDPPSKCPKFGKSRRPLSPTTTAGSVEEGISLPSGEDLDANGVFEIARSRLARLIVIAGAADAGKTTLIASLYERFQYGSVSDYMFAGSTTLLGFERRCHLARAACRGLLPDTERTTISGGPRFLHLSLAKRGSPTARRDLILSDIAGEAFRQARDSSEDALKLAFVARADRFVLLLDGAKLIDARSRNATRTEGDQILRAMLDVAFLGAHSYVDIVFTKWDRVLGSPEKSAIDAFVADTNVLFQERFGRRIGRLRTFHTALRRSTTGGSAPGYDVDQLLPPWLEETWLEAVPAPVGPNVDSDRSFDRFTHAPAELVRS